MPLPIIDRFLSLFTGSGDPEAEKKRQLKQIAKDLSKHKYRFYKTRGEEVQPLFAKFFYDVYKLVSPAQVFMQNAEKSVQLKQIVIDNFLDKNLLEIQERLSDDSIYERAKTTDTKILSQELKDDLVSFFAGFDGEKTRSIDNCYNTIIAFYQFVNFDYFFLLKKFDSNLPERNFTYQPKFEAIRSDYISDDVKDFLEVLLPLDAEQDWKMIFQVLRDYKGVEVIAVDQWIKLLVTLRDIKKSGILELMVRYIDKKPEWRSKSRYSDEHIVEHYLQKLKTQIEVNVQKVLQERRNAKIEQLAIAVFGTAAVSRMKHYTERANIAFSKKMLGGYIYIQGLNYLKAFLLDYFKKDVRELCDLFLVRGQWSTNLMSQQLSEGFHDLLEISEKLLAFDDALADDGETGSRLRTAMAKSDRDKEQVKYLRILLKGINEDAQKMINTSAQACISIGKNLKNILEDYQHVPHSLIINWKEIELASEKPIDRRITEVYKKIYYFVQLMQFYAKAG